MSNTIKTTKVATALTERSTHNLSAVHVTTADFMQLNVSKCIELVPKQTLDINHKMFTRLAPMYAPILGNANVRHYSFFVPYRTIMQGFEEFITRVPVPSKVGNISLPTMINYAPHLTNSQFVKLLTQPQHAEYVEFSNFAYDFEYYDDELHNYRRMKFTYEGRLLYKLLRSLGYGILFNSQSGDVEHDACALLCYLKVFSDWFYPSQYADDPFQITLKEIFTRIPKDDEPFITTSELLNIMRTVLYITYDSDIFNNAWDNPVAPNDANYSSIYIPDPTTQQGGGVSASELSGKLGTPIIDGPESITQFKIDSLHALNDYVSRHRLSGARVIDRYYARFGTKLDSAKLDISVLVDVHGQDIDFGDIMSTASTEGATLGDYAGKGISYGNGSFSVSSDEEYGMFIMVSSIIPRTSIVQGALRHTFLRTATDFWTPELDFGVQLMAQRELYVPTDGHEDAEYYERGFGFVPRYAHYKVGNDQLTGDFSLNSMNVGTKSWHLFRDVKDFYDKDELVHSPDFITGYDASQFNRIFSNTDNNADHFYIIHGFNINSSFPSTSLYDSYEFKDEDKAEKVDLNIGGSTLN